MRLEDMPLQLDDWFTFATELEESGRWDVAARVFRHISSTFGDLSLVLPREANALYHFGDYRGAIRVLSLMPRQTVSTLIIKARCHRGLGEMVKAIISYDKARKILG